MAAEHAGAGEGGAPDDEGPFAGEDVQEGIVCRVEDLVAEEVMHVVVLGAVGVGGVGGHGVHGELALNVVDDVGRVVDVADSGGWGGPKIAGGCAGG